MNRKALAVVALALAVLGSGFVLPARAAPPQPYNLYGLARASDGTTPLAQNTRITAFIDGVDYSNASSVYTASGNYDVDTFGDWVTQIGQPNTPERKEGGTVGDEIMYVAGDMTTSGQVFTTKKFWTPGDVVLENIQLAAQQPNLLKICKLVPYPNDTWPPYAYIFNPGAAVPGSQYYLQKDVLGSYAGPTFALSGTINPGFTYVNMTPAYTFAAGGDNLRLTWDNPGGSGFGGSDIIVDRVEFNATAGGTLYWEPGNTDMTDAPGPGPGQGITRDVACGDTNSNAVDFSLGAVPRPGVDPAPTVTVTTPNGGQDWTGGTPHDIVWDMNDNQATPLSYIIGLSTDGGATYPIFVTSGTQPKGIGRLYTWTVNTVDTTQARIQICVVDDNFQTACDVSNADFTIDSTRPALTNSNPANGAVSVDVMSNIIVTFSEPMNRPATEGAVSFAPPLVGGATYSWTALPEELTVNPNNPMAISTSYTVTVACVAEDDSDTGNALASCPRTFGFTTAAGTPPPIVDLTAPNGGELWSGNTVHDIAWTMTDDGPGNLQVWLNYSTTGGGPYPNLIASLSRAQGSNVYQWTTPCISSTTVRVQVTASDGTGTSSDASSANFAIDCARPTVLSTVPTPSATEVALAPPIVITFSERMEDLVTRNAVTITPGVSGIGFSWSAGGDVLTITHNDFAMCVRPPTPYTVTVGTTAEDVSDPGNTLSPAYSWSFSTICGPTVALSAPAGGEVWTGNTPHNVVATATDADAQVRMTVQISTDGGATWPTTLDGPTFRPTGSAQTISVTIPAVDTTIARIRVIAQDSSGINGTATSPPFAIDATAPTVASSVPANAATGVSLSDPFTITFSEEMNPTTTDPAITLTPAAGALTVTWNAAHTVATVAHATSLTRGQPYTLAVQVSARDISDPGNALNPAYSATFTATTVSPVTADAGPDKTGTVGGSLNFDGGGSTGPITEYEWEFVSPGGVSSFDTGETVSHAFSQEGTWTVILNVTDASGNWDTDEATVTITAAPQQDFLSAYWWLFLILILAVVLAIIFLLFGRRRKKEEEMPEAVPAEKVVTTPPAAPAKAPPKAAPPVAVAAAAKGAPTTRDCPSCGTIVDQTDTECFMCGAKL